METTCKEKCSRGACARPYTERPAVTISYFVFASWKPYKRIIYIKRSMQTNKKISKVPRVGEIVLTLFSLLCFVVCVAFALLLATGHIEDSSLGSNEASRTSRRESERTCSESRRTKGYRYISSKVLFEDPWIPSASTSRLFHQNSSSFSKRASYP